MFVFDVHRRLKAMKAEVARYKEIADSKVYPQRLRPATIAEEDEEDDAVSLLTCSCVIVDLR